MQQTVYARQARLSKAGLFLCTKTKNKQNETGSNCIDRSFSTGFDRKQTEQPHKEFLKHCKKEENRLPL